MNGGLLEAGAGTHLEILTTTIDNRGGGLTAAAGGAINLIGAGLIGGTLTGAGVFQTFSGTNVFDGTTSTILNQSTVSISDGTVLNASGTIDNAGRISGAGGQPCRPPERRRRGPDPHRRRPGIA